MTIRGVKYHQLHWTIIELLGQLIKNPTFPRIRGKVQLLLKEYLPAANIYLHTNGRSSLSFVLKAIGIGQNTVILAPAFVCADGVLEPLANANLTIFYYDLNEDLTVDIDYLRHRCSATGAKIVLITHLGGKISAVTESDRNWFEINDVLLLEDCAQSFGARSEDGSFSGSKADAAIYSFGLGKSLVGAGGGIAAINNVQKFKNLSITESWAATSRNRIGISKCLKFLIRASLRKTWFPLEFLRSRRVRSAILVSKVEPPEPITLLQTLVLNIIIPKLERVKRHYLANGQEYQKRLGSRKSSQYKLIFSENDLCFNIMVALPTQKSRDHLEAILHKLGIDTTVLYYSHGPKNEFPMSSKLETTTLFLPIARKIDAKRFDIISKAISKFESEEKAI